MLSLSRFRTLAFVAVSMFVMVSLAYVNETRANFTTTFATFTSDFAGATFTPSVASAISARETGNAITLTWSIVSISSGAAVNYEIVRYAAGVAQVVCTAPGAITFTTTTAQCRDDTAQPTTQYTYTQQPFVLRGGVRTWSLPVSVASDPACVRKCR